MTVARASSERSAAEILCEALPFIKRFAGTTIVVKYGGSALKAPVGNGTRGAHEGGEKVSDEALKAFAEDIVLLGSVGIRPVVVHGGGPQIDTWMERLGLVPKFREGLRVTDSETLEIARMVLLGRVNRDIVGAINAHGPLGVGLSGEDAKLIRASQRDPALGYVGDVRSVDPRLLHHLIDAGLVPVVATIGSDDEGQAYNINADTVAGAVAEALGASKLVYLTDVDGIRERPDDPDSLLTQVTAAEIGRLIAKDVITGGMVPKATACARAVKSGVASAHILDGRVRHSLLLELLSVEGVGTMVNI